MKRILIPYLILIIILQACSNKNNGIKITAKVENSDSEYVYLDYQSLYRGNLNFEGFKSVASRIDNKGSFVLTSKNAIDYGDYWIALKDKAFHLILANGDNLKLLFDLNNIDSTFFAKGKGAGKINILRLKQFKTYLAFDSTFNRESFKRTLDSIDNSRLQLLDAIYRKEVNSDAIQNAENYSQIKRIITESPQTEKEFTFLKKIILMNNIYQLDEFLNYYCQISPSDSSIIDFDSPYFNSFDLGTYKLIDNINYWQFEDCINKILKVEYLKFKHQSNKDLAYNAWSSAIKDYTDYRNWGFSYLKDNFNPEVFDRYYASALAFELTLGEQHEDLYKDFSKTCSNIEYKKRIDKYLGLIQTGLTIPEYDLNNPIRTLDSIRFYSLINSFKGKPLYLVVWSAEYAGATLISELPVVLDFEKENLDRLKVVYLCIDESKNKGLWAARIIDNSWKGLHYFLPVEGNESVIKFLGAKNNDGFCYGGVTYSLIKKDGTLINSIEPPIKQTEERINQ